MTGDNPGRLYVKSYNAQQNYHDCVDARGHTHHVDLRVDGGIPRDITDEALVGRWVVCDSLSPFLVIANDVALQEPQP